MKTRQRQFGMTLTEVTFTVAIVALLAVLTTPAIKTFFSSLGTTGEVRAVINNALSNARSIAVQEQKYAGVRFQQDAKGNQYLVYIINNLDPDPVHGNVYKNSFKAVEGTKPMKLSENIAVMDLAVVLNRSINTINYKEARLNDDFTLTLPADDYIVQDSNIADVTTFAIIFSPQGKVVIHGYYVRNRDNYTPANDNSQDGVFNTKFNVDRGIGFLYQDDYDGSAPANLNLGYGPEYSRTSFVIYDKSELKGVDKNSRWTQFFYNKPVQYLNAYTGEIINTE